MPRYVNLSESSKGATLPRRDGRDNAGIASHDTHLDFSEMLTTPHEEQQGFQSITGRVATAAPGGHSTITSNTLSEAPVNNHEALLKLHNDESDGDTHPDRLTAEEKEKERAVQDDELAPSDVSDESVDAGEAFFSTILQMLEERRANMPHNSRVDPTMNFPTRVITAFCKLLASGKVRSKTEFLRNQEDLLEGRLDNLVDIGALIREYLRTRHGIGILETGPLVGTLLVIILNTFYDHALTLMDAIVSAALEHNGNQKLTVQDFAQFRDIVINADNERVDDAIEKTTKESAIYLLKIDQDKKKLKRHKEDRKKRPRRMEPLICPTCNQVIPEPAIPQRGAESRRGIKPAVNDNHTTDSHTHVSDVESGASNSVAPLEEEESPPVLATAVPEEEEENFPASLNAGGEAISTAASYRPYPERTARSPKRIVYRSARGDGTIIQSTRRGRRITVPASRGGAGMASSQPQAGPSNIYSPQPVDAWSAEIGPHNDFSSGMYTYPPPPAFVAGSMSPPGFDNSYLSTAFDFSYLRTLEPSAEMAPSTGLKSIVSGDGPFLPVAPATRVLVNTKGSLSPTMGAPSPSVFETSMADLEAEYLNLSDQVEQTADAEPRLASPRQIVVIPAIPVATPSGGTGQGPESVEDYNAANMSGLMVSSLISSNAVDDAQSQTTALAGPPGQPALLQEPSRLFEIDETSAEGEPASFAAIGSPTQENYNRPSMTVSTASPTSFLAREGTLTPSLAYTAPSIVTWPVDPPRSISPAPSVTNDSATLPTPHPLMSVGLLLRATSPPPTVRSIARRPSVSNEAPVPADENTISGTGLNIPAVTNADTVHLVNLDAATALKDDDELEASAKVVNVKPEPSTAVQAATPLTTARNGAAPAAPVRSPGLTGNATEPVGIMPKPRRVPQVQRANTPATVRRSARLTAQDQPVTASNTTAPIASTSTPNATASRKRTNLSRSRVSSSPRKAPAKKTRF